MALYQNAPVEPKYENPFVEPDEYEDMTLQPQVNKSLTAERHVYRNMPTLPHEECIGYLEPSSPAKNINIYEEVPDIFTGGSYLSLECDTTTDIKREKHDCDSTSDKSSGSLHRMQRKRAIVVFIIVALAIGIAVGAAIVLVPRTNSASTSTSPVPPAPTTMIPASTVEPTVDGPTEASSSKSPATTLILTGSSTSTSPVTPAPTTMISAPTTTLSAKDRLPDTNWTSCSDIHSSNPSASSGVYTIHIGGQGREVWCDMVTDGGGWTRFQFRHNGSESFDRTLEEYRKGFGSASAEFWLGNDDLHLLTNQPSELRVELWDFNNAHGYALYSNFSIGNASSNYQLHVGGYNGTIGDSLTYHNSQQFSTNGQDNDIWPYYNCATSQGGGGGWWYKKCHYSNLNGRYYPDAKITRSGMTWVYWQNNDYSYKAASMLTRPRQ